MEWWQIVLPAVAAVAVIIALLAAAYRRGVRAGSGEASNEPLPEECRSIFGDDVPVRMVERQLVAVMPDALIVCDANGEASYISPGAHQLGLANGGTVTLRDLTDTLTLVAADSVAREREITLPIERSKRVPAVNSNGKGVEAGQQAPSSTLYLRVRIGQITDDLYAIFIKDMSEQRRFEAVRRDFVTNVSHELKTPAGAISLLAETIGDAADDPDAVRYFSGRIVKESARLTELLHRLIDLQKAQSLVATLNARKLSVMSVVREAIAENAVQAKDSDITIRLSFNGAGVSLEIAPDDAVEIHDAAGKDVAIMADEDAIKTAVKNLVENAIHYSPKHTTVVVGVVSTGDKVIIRVVDQGIGIPAASLDRIFERFYRVDPARSRATGGTGLGLAITKHCVQDCGGTISVWSREGEGSTFTIELPAYHGDDTHDDDNVNAAIGDAAGGDAIDAATAGRNAA